MGLNEPEPSAGAEADGMVAAWRAQFRGPPLDVECPYILFLGGSETYGKFVGEPYPALVARRLGVRTLNMGAMNAGLDVLIADPAVAAASRRAVQIVVQVPGAANLSNRFYRVHPRRNDRFVCATAALNRLFPDFDPTEVHFTRHLLMRLRALSGTGFEVVVAALRERWLERMDDLIAQMPAPVHLVWASARGVEQAAEPHDLDADPLFVTPQMIASLRARVAGVIETPAQPAGSRRTTAGMDHAAAEAAIARRLPGPAFHHRAASILTRALTPAVDQTLSVSSGTASNRSATRP